MTGRVRRRAPSAPMLPCPSISPYGVLSTPGGVHRCAPATNRGSMPCLDIHPPAHRDLSRLNGAHGWSQGLVRSCPSHRGTTDQPKVTLSRKEDLIDLTYEHCSLISLRLLPPMVVPFAAWHRSHCGGWVMHDLRRAWGHLVNHCNHARFHG